MIALLRGRIYATSTDHLVLETGGIGYLVYVPRPLLTTLTVGDDLEIHTVLIVREDSLTLYGFAAPEQRTIFETLLGVTGVGPRVALNLLSSLSSNELRTTIAQKDTARLSRVPGIGKKMAERLVLELTDKLDIKDILPVSPEAGAPSQTTNTDLVDVLISLGYNPSEANAAVASLPADAPDELEERLRLALRYFGGA